MTPAREEGSNAHAVADREQTTALVHDLQMHETPEKEKGCAFTPLTEQKQACMQKIVFGGGCMFLWFCCFLRVIMKK